MVVGGQVLVLGMGGNAKKRGSDGSTLPSQALLCIAHCTAFDLFTQLFHILHTKLYIFAFYIACP